MKTAKSKNKPRGEAELYGIPRGAGLPKKVKTPNMNVKGKSPVKQSRYHR